MASSASLAREWLTGRKVPVGLAFPCSITRCPHSFCSRIPSFPFSTPGSFHNAKMTLRYLSRQHFFKLPHTFHASRTPIFQGINNQAVRCLSSSQIRYKMATDYSQLPTPDKCYVDFCLIPVSCTLESYNYPSIACGLLSGTTLTSNPSRLGPETPPSQRKWSRCKSCSKRVGWLTPCTLPGQQLVSQDLPQPLIPRHTVSLQALTALSQQKADGTKS